MAAKGFGPVCVQVDEDVDTAVQPMVSRVAGTISTANAVAVAPACASLSQATTPHKVEVVMHLQNAAATSKMNATTLEAWIRDEGPDARKPLKEFDKQPRAQCNK